MAEVSKWRIVVAEEELRVSTQPRIWPCTEVNDSHRYRGCIGVSHCRALGTETCIFGRWPATDHVEWDRHG